MGRRRNAPRSGWPANLYERAGYFSWRNPADGREYGLGRDRHAAFAQAVEANLHIAQLSCKTRLVDRLTGARERTLDAWMTRYAELLEQRALADATRRSYKSLDKIIREKMPLEKSLSAITTLDCVTAIQAITGEGKARTAQAVRSHLKDIFREAIASGWLERNPVEVTRAVEVKVKRARLDFDTFMAVYDQTKLDWLRNAMALAIVSSQRREDIVGARLADVWPIDDGSDMGWWIDQGKTGNRLILPLSLRLDRFGMSLGDVVRQCRASGVLSRHLIHQTRPRGNSPVGSPIHIDRVSKAFSDAVENIGRNWGDKNPPTFHEIRSLSERLYAEQGNINTQDLLGHKDPRTTQTYHDSRGDWVRVKVG